VVKRSVWIGIAGCVGLAAGAASNAGAASGNKPDGERVRLTLSTGQDVKPLLGSYLVVARLRDEHGPLQGERVTFVVTGADGITRAAAQTDERGETRIGGSGLAEPGVSTVIACWDRNQDLDCEGELTSAPLSLRWVAESTAGCTLQYEGWVRTEGGTP